MTAFETFVVGLLVGLPVTVVVVWLHEMGHALAALAVGAERVTVRVGGDAVSFCVGPFAFEFGVGWAGWARARGLDGAGVAARVFHYAGGPLSSFLLGAGAWWAGRVALVGSPWAAFTADVVAVSAMAIFVGTALPGVYPKWMGVYAGRPSDGLRIWRELEGERG